MHCYLCNLISEEITLLEHEDSKWLTKEELDVLNWLPADEGLIENLKSLPLLD